MDVERFGSSGLDRCATRALTLAPIPSLLLTVDGLVTWGNPALARLLGSEVDDLIGTCILEHIVEAGHPAVVDHLLRTARSTSFTRSSPSSRPRPGPEGDPLTVILRTSGGPGRDADLHLAAVDVDTVLAQVVTVPKREDAGSLAEQRAFRTAILELSQLAHDEIDDAEFYTRLLASAIEVIPGAQGGAVLLSDRRAEHFKIVAAMGVMSAGVIGRSISALDMVGDLNQAEAVIQKFNAHTRLPMNPETAEWLIAAGFHMLKSNVAAPVLRDGRAIAFISLDNYEDTEAFTPASAEMTTVLGRLIADLLHRRTLEAELRRERESFKHLALHDGLTGLANRRQLELAISHGLEVVDKEGESLAVLFIDLDDFKQVNDQLGHDVGDCVLVAISDTLRHATRAQDLVGRWGGDEFVVVSLAIGDDADANRLAERVLDACCGNLRLSDGSTVPCNLSIGVAWTDDGDDTPEALLRRADAALYEAKLGGKGQIRLSVATPG